MTFIFFSAITDNEEIFVFFLEKSMVRNVSEEIFADFLNALDRVKNFPKRVHGKIGGLRYSELALIFTIGELREKNGNVIATDLASSLLVSRAAVTPTIRVLTKKGLIDRKVESSDGRKAGLFLTEKGESVLKAARDYHYRLFSEFADSIGVERVVEFTVLLNLFSSFMVEKI